MINIYIYWSFARKYLLMANLLGHISFEVAFQEANMKFQQVVPAVNRQKPIPKHTNIYIYIYIIYGSKQHVAMLFRTSKYPNNERSISKHPKTMLPCCLEPANMLSGRRKYVQKPISKHPNNTGFVSGCQCKQRVHRTK